MDFSFLKKTLAANARIIELLVEAVSSDQARWKPGPDRWSILEVINHLYDEEREDFRLHLDIMLHHPDQDWSPIDPMGWLTARHYNQRDLDKSITNFLQERRNSMDWLESLGIPNWESTVEAPWGPMKAGDMFAAWVIHDQWHIQQIMQLKRDYATESARPYSVQYAGSL